MKELFKIAVTDCHHKSMEIEKNIFAKAGLDFEHFKCRTEDDVIEFCRGYNILLNQYAPIGRKAIENLPGLKLVVRYGVGFNNVDLEAATEHGIQVCNVPDYGTNEVADHTFALTLMLARKTYMMGLSVKKSEWDFKKSIPIFRPSEQTVGIIGLGRIGVAYAKRAHAFNYNIKAVDIKEVDVPEYVTMTSFEDILTTSDIISIHCPLDNNRDLISEKELKAMKTSAFLINTARGGVVNEVALNKALEEKWIAGAGFDVSVKEPIMTDSPLLKHDNFILTPHMAWYSQEAEKELKNKAATEAFTFITEGKVKYPVNSI